MKNTKKALLTSVSTIALSAALIAGSTFALFTGEARTNVAITAGKVSVEAEIKEFKTYSAEWNAETNAYIYPERGDGSFVNGGSASLEGNGVAITNITPGDGVKFNIDVTNNSTVKIKYQTVVSVTAPEDDEPGNDYVKLYKGLEIRINDDRVNDNRTTAVSEWTEVEQEATIDPISVEISLPMEASSELQGLACRLLVGVYAIQSNGHDDSNQSVYFVDGNSDLQGVIADAQDGDTIAFVEDVEVTDETPLEIENKDITWDLQGSSVSASKKTPDGEVVSVTDGGSLTITGSGDERGSYTLNVENMGDSGISSYEDGYYGMRVQDGTLNIDNIDFTIDTSGVGYDEEGEPIQGHAIFVKNGTVNVGEQTNVEFVAGSGETFGIFISDGSTMNVDGAYMHSYGVMAPITVGTGSGAESVLNLNEGTRMYYEASGSWSPALQAYPNGVINIYDSEEDERTTEIKVYGAIASGDAAAAIGTIGGGTVNVYGGQIILEPTRGEAYAVMIRANFFYEDGELVGQQSMSHVTFSGSSLIKAIYGNATTYGFLAQRNYVYRYDGSVEYDDSYAITLEPTVHFLYGKTESELAEISYSHNYFARVGSGYVKDKAIDDQRSISKA